MNPAKEKFSNVPIFHLSIIPWVEQMLQKIINSFKFNKLYNFQGVCFEVSR